VRSLASLTRSHRRRGGAAGRLVSLSSCEVVARKYCARRFDAALAEGRSTTLTLRVAHLLGQQFHPAQLYEAAGIHRQERAWRISTSVKFAR
jgi:hypothetical protein